MGTSLKKVAKKAKDYKYVLLVMRHAKSRRQRPGRAQDGADAHCVLQRHQGQADLRSHA